MVLGLCVFQPSGNTTQPSDDAAATELFELVTAYFKAPKSSQRAKIASQIAEQADSDLDAVANAVGQVQLWSPQKSGFTSFELKTRGETKTPVDVFVPRDYDPSQAYPLVVVLHGQGGRGRGVLGYLWKMLGQHANNFIIAAPTGYRGCSFMEPEDAAGDPPALLSELVRRYHVDRDRIYLVGFSMGGHAAYIMATLHGCHFASVVSVAGTLVLPYTQLCSLLLPNMLNTPVMAVWGKEDRFDGEGKPAIGGGIAGVNRRLRRLARKGDLPFTAFEVEEAGHMDVEPPIEPLLGFLQMKRRAAPKTIVHYFRYPEQGRSGWLRQIKFLGRPWNGAQLSVITRPGVDFDEYVVEAVRKKLAYFGGTIEGQDIDLQMRRTDKLELLLNDKLIDLDKPIHLKVNGKIRFEDQAKPSIKTLLKIAHRDWDFQNLYSVRLIVGRKALARQD